MFSVSRWSVLVLLEFSSVSLFLAKISNENFYIYFTLFTSCHPLMKSLATLRAQIKKLPVTYCQIFFTDALNLKYL